MITLTKDPANVLDVPTKYFTWFRQRQNDKGYFEYPDKNKVDVSDTRYPALLYPPPHRKIANSCFN